MNKSESKYFNTAVRMDEAFLKLLEKKELPYITVKEICERAGVNRSTFYLHYETIDDLLDESIQHMFTNFTEHMAPVDDGVLARLRDCPMDELYLVTPRYLAPYLAYIRDHRRLFRTAVAHFDTFRLQNTYDRMFRHIFSPILERFQVPERDRRYLVWFYIHGLMAIIMEWINQDCADSMEHVISVIQRCVLPHADA